MANPLLINKTDRGISHAPPGDPMFVPEGGTVRACNKKKSGNVTVTVRFDGEVTFRKRLKPGECVELIVGSEEMPDGDYFVSDPPTVMTFVGVRHALFTFAKRRGNTLKGGRFHK